MSARRRLNRRIVGLVIAAIGCVFARSALADFDDDNRADLAVGVATEDVGAIVDAGALNVLYGSSDGITELGDQVWTQDDLVADASEQDDRLGIALATGDFDGDGVFDLAVGVAGETIGTAERAGAVQIIYGLSGVGLAASGSQFWHQDSPLIGGACESDDEFGGALAAGDFNGDGFDDLAIAAPGESAGGADGAGAVNVIYGAPGGLASAGNQIWYEGNNGLVGTPETDDHFGRALAAGDFDADGYSDLAVSIPMEDLGTEIDAGRVVVLYGTPDGLSATDAQAWVQGLAGLPNSYEESDYFGYSMVSGDFNGDGFADLGVGAPFEDIAAENSAGAVVVLYGSVGGLSAYGSQFWSDDGIEEGDAFGYALAAGDLNRDGYGDMAVGIPLEDLGGVLDAGAVGILYGSEDGLFRRAANDFWHQDRAGILDVCEDYDWFGITLGTGDFNGDGFVDLAVGVPYESVGSSAEAGAVQVLYGSEDGVTAIGNQFWNQNSPGVEGLAEPLDRFGSALATVPLEGLPFSDGFESGSTSRWSVTMP